MAYNLPYQEVMIDWNPLQAGNHAQAFTTHIPFF
jgi:hypothetical protein